MMFSSMFAFIMSSLLWYIICLLIPTINLRKRKEAIKIIEHLINREV